MAIGEPSEKRNAKPKRDVVQARPTLLTEFGRSNRQWHDVEIEGEAETVELVPAVAAPLAVDTRTTDLQDVTNDIIIATLDTRHLQVAVGETALFHLTVLNNGDRQASMEVAVEGAVNEGWVVITAGGTESAATAFPVNPGEQIQLALAITPPRTPQSAAGDHPLQVIVRAAAYPRHVSQLHARLTIAPYTDFALGELRPRQIASSWRHRQGETLLPLTNRSNHPVTFTIRTRLSSPGYRCSLLAANLEKGADGQARLTLPPSRRLLVTAQVTPHVIPWFGLTKRRARLQFFVAPEEQPQLAKTANLRLSTKPIFGLWHGLTLLALAISAGLGVIVLTVAATVLALRPAQAPPIVNQPAANPPISIVVNLAQPAPTSPAVAPLRRTTPLTQTLTANVVNLPAEQAAADPRVPVVQIDQISNPGTTQRPAFVPATQPITNAKSAISNLPAPQTYQQMFQEIALRYDLNWRVLAAQAYIESGFDSLALGKQGDMGLMQILPSTWHEWAPAVNASDPFDSYSNVLVAAVYLDHLRGELGKKGYPQIEWMLVAYNWGIDKVLDHLASGQGWADLPATRRQYALDILRIAETIPPG